MPQPAAEFYPASSEAAVLVRVNIWGEVSRPGVYLLPLGTSVTSAVSFAGGPTAAAVFPEAHLLRETRTVAIDLLGSGTRDRVQENDMIYVDRSFKSDLAVCSTVLSIALSTATLYVVVRQSR